MGVVLGALLLSYLVGAIPWSYLAGRVFGGIDLRRVGSGNLGATNTFRALGARVAIPVLGLDILKGIAAPLVFAPLAHGLLAENSLAESSGLISMPVLATLCGIAAILGHMFPVYMRFRGGKGIATTSGVFLALEPWAFLVCFVVFVVAFAASGGIVSLGSLLASLVLPVAMYIVGTVRGELDWTRLGLSIGLVVVVWIKHAANIRRLVRRTEKSVFAPRNGGPQGRAA